MFLSVPEMLLILLVLMIFAGKQLPQMTRNLALAIKEFKKVMNSVDEYTEENINDTTIKNTDEIHPKTCSCSHEVKETEKNINE